MFGPRPNVPVGKLDIQTLAERDVACRAEAAASAVAQEGKAALQSALIAERLEELGAAIKLVALGIEIAARRAPQPSLQHLHALRAMHEPAQQRLGLQAADDAFEPCALGPAAAHQRRQRAPSQSIEPVARTQQTSFEEPQP